MRCLRLRRPRNQRRNSNQRGIAMLMALITMTLLGFLAAQLVYETEVYHRIVFNNIDKLRSRYLAKSALKLGLLQLQAADKARKKAQSLGGGNLVSEDMLEMIWQTPIIFPAPSPPDADGFEKRAIDDFNKTMGLNGRLSVSIEGQSSKLNLNELVWLETKTAAPAGQQGQQGQQGGQGQQSGTQPATPLTPEQEKEKMEKRRKTYVELLQQIIDNQKIADEKFERKYSNISGEALLKNIIAWIDPETSEDGENRPKEEYYKSHNPPYKIKNAPLYSMSEIFMIKGFDDDLAKLMYDNFDAAITEGIHINTAGRSLIRGLIPTLTDKDLDAVIEKREKEPFKDAEAFWKFLSEQGGDYTNVKNELNEKGIKLTTSETSYRVTVSSSSGDSSRSWVAYVGPSPPEPKTAPANQNQPNPFQQPAPNQGQNPSAGGQNATQKPDDTQGPNILYLKAD